MAVRSIAAALLLFGILFLSSCDPDTTAKSYGYEAVIEVSGETGAGMDIAVTDETAGVTLDSQSGLTSLPYQYRITGSIDYYDRREVSVDVVANSLAAGGSYTVVITYTETAYSGGYPTTIREETRTNGTGSATNVSFRHLLTLPY